MFTVNSKQQLFERMKTKGLFWSYAPDICYDPQKDNLLCETVLKYADMDDIHKLFALYGKEDIQRVWEQTVKTDTNRPISKEFRTGWWFCVSAAH